jgi:ABC-type multidrug transport system ATPase subunit
MSEIEAEGLVKRLGGTARLDAVDLVVRPGEVVALLGPNGAGKTTLLRVLAGMLRPDAGSARVGGRDVVTERAAAAATVGHTIAPEPAWYLRLSGRQNLEFFAVVAGVERDAAAAAVSRSLREHALVDDAQRSVGTYSRGMRARLALARATLADPPVLLLDEPGAHLDMAGAEQLTRCLATRREDRAVLIATHAVEQAVAADRAVVLKEGRVAAELAGPLEPDTIVAALAARP